MKRRLDFLALLAVVFLFVACEPQTAVEEPAMDMDALKSEIQVLEDMYAKAENAKDVEGIMAYYADDAHSLPDGEPKVMGKEALRQRMAEQLPMDTSGNTIKFTVEEVFAAGDYVVEVGSSVSMNPAGEQIGSGKYMVLFEKRGDKYVALRDIWNSDEKDDDDDDDDDDEM